MYHLLICLFIFMLTGCTTIGTILPTTLGERSSGYGYIPLDGLAVDQTFRADSCKPWRLITKDKTVDSTPSDFIPEAAGKDPFKPLLQSLPDISVRFAVASIDTSGGLMFGPAKITAKNKNYRAILDYVNVDAIPVSLWIVAYKTDGSPIKPSQLNHDVLAARYEVTIAESDKNPPKIECELVTVPVYVGIGMRLSADIRAIEGGVPLTSLGSIGLEAQAQKLTGTLTVQTIGITGESVAAALPLPSKLDQTTIENGILSIGSNRAVIYKSQSDTGNGIITTPRVVGLYSPIGSEPALINAIYSELSRTRPKWARPCKAI